MSAPRRSRRRRAGGVVRKPEARQIAPAPIVRVSERTKVTHRASDFEPYWGETSPVVEVTQSDTAFDLFGDWT